MMKEIIMKGGTNYIWYDGSQSHNDSFLWGMNQQYIKMALPLVPKWLQTYHITALTYLWAVLAFLSGFLAKTHIQWLWLMAFSIFGHYLTDALDGEVGRKRRTGLVRWGFYVDHFGDFVFSICILIGLSYPTPPILFRWLLVIMGVWATFFVNAYFIWILKKRYILSFFRIGTIEVQFALALLVMSFAIFGPKVLAISLRIVVPASIIGLAIVFFSTQSQLRKEDMRKYKRKNSRSQSPSRRLRKKS
jgi:phosphatidylglycerophosphate synthase